MQVNLSPVTSAALKADGTIRCLADVQYQPVPASQHSSTALSLAKELADEFTAALLAQLGQAMASHAEYTSKTPASAPAQRYALYYSTTVTV
jgi:hypothetical protein